MPKKSLPDPDSPMMKLARGTVGGASLLTVGSASVEAFGIGTSVVSTGTALIAEAETVAAAIPVIGGTAAGLVGEFGAGSVALGVALAPVVSVAVPLALGGAAGYAIGTIAAELMDI